MLACTLSLDLSLPLTHTKAVGNRKVYSYYSVHMLMLAFALSLFLLPHLLSFSSLNRHHFLISLYSAHASPEGAIIERPSNLLDPRGVPH